MKLNDWLKIFGYAAAIIGIILGVNRATAPDYKPNPPAINLTMPVVPNKAASTRDDEQDQSINSLKSKVQTLETFLITTAKPVGTVDVLPVDPPHDNGQAPGEVEKPKEKVSIKPFIDEPEVRSMYSQEIVPWQYNLEDARALSKKSNRPLIICFTTDGCGPCILRDRNVYPVSRVWQKMHREFISVYLHVSGNTNKSAADFYGISRYPRTVIDDGKNTPKVFMPADNPDGFLAQLK